MVVWEKVDWKRKEKMAEVRMTKRMALLLLASLNIPQFFDTIRPFINNHVSRSNSAAFKLAGSINLATTYYPIY